MFRTPDIYGYFTATLTPFKRFTASLSGTYTGSMLVQHLAGYIPLDKAVETPDFFDMNIKLAYEFPLYKELKLEVNGGAFNHVMPFEKTCTCFVKNTYVFPKKDVRVFLKAK